MSAPDKLEQLFDMQQQLNLRIGVDPTNMTEEERQQWVLQYTRALSQEVAELIDSVPWKWWAKYQTFDQQNARVEIVDCMHFVISIAQCLGMTAEDFHGLYVKKNEVNFKRQDSGYDNKDEDDNKDLTV